MMARRGDRANRRARRSVGEASAAGRREDSAAARSRVRAGATAGRASSADG